MQKTAQAKPALAAGATPQAAQKSAIPFAETVRMCSKCCRKLGAEGKALRASVKDALKTSYGPEVALEKVDCFSLCPKNSQVLATFAKGQARRLVIIEPGSDIEATLDYLLRPHAYGVPLAGR